MLVTFVLSLSPALLLQAASETTPSRKARDVSEWRATGIGGGPLACVAFDPADPERVLAGSERGGVFQSEDGGATWTRTSEGLGATWVRALAVDASDPRRVLAATESGVSRSTDGGRTWQTVLELALANPERPRAGFACVVLDGEVAWAGVGDFRQSEDPGPGGDDLLEHPHLWKSDAFGASGSWTPVPGPFDAGAVHTVLPASDGLFVSSTEGVWRGSFDGAAWTFASASGAGETGLPHGDARDLAALFDEQGELERLYVVLNSHWNESIPFTAITIYDYDNGHGGGVWFSDDLGATWAPTTFLNWSDQLFLDLGYIDESGVHYPKNVRRIALDQATGEVYLALTWGNATNEGVWRADPAAGPWLWQRITASNVELDYAAGLGGIDALARHPSGDLVFTTRSGAYRGRGAAWAPLHTVELAGGFRQTGLDTVEVRDLAVAPGAPLVWFACALELGLLRSDDGGASWRPLAPTGDCTRIRFLPDGSESLAVIDAELRRTASLPGAGSTWETLAVPASAVRDVLVLDSDHVLVATADGLFAGARTIDSQWIFVRDEAGIPVGTSAEVAVLSAAPSPFERDRPMLVAYAKHAGLAGGVFTRELFGAAWQPVSFAGAPKSLSERFGSLAWSGTTRVYAATTDGVVLASDDAGQRFAPVHELGQGVAGLAVLRRPDGGERLFAGFAPSGGVVYSDDGGASFGEHSDGLRSGWTTFLAGDPTHPARVFHGARGGGTSVLRLRR